MFKVNDKDIRTMSNVNNKDTRTTVKHTQTIRWHQPFCSVSIVNFEQVNADWDYVSGYGTLSVFIFFL